MPGLVDGRLSAARRPGGAAGNRGRGFAGVVPNPTFDTTPPDLPKDLKDGGLLIFSKTNGNRDDPAIQASKPRSSHREEAGLARVRHRERGGDERRPAQDFQGHRVEQHKRRYTHRRAARSVQDLARERRRLRRHPRRRRDPSYAWAWYPEALIGAQFTEHSSRQPGTVHIEDRSSPITKGLPENWERTVATSGIRSRRTRARRACTFLRPPTSIPTTRAARRWARITLSCGSHCVGKGRVFFSAIGHPAEAYTDEPLTSCCSRTPSPGPSGRAAVCRVPPRSERPAPGAYVESGPFHEHPIGVDTWSGPRRSPRPSSHGWLRTSRPRLRLDRLPLETVSDVDPARARDVLEAHGLGASACVAMGRIDLIPPDPAVRDTGMQLVRDKSRRPRPSVPTASSVRCTRRSAGRAAQTADEREADICG